MLTTQSASLQTPPRNPRPRVETFFIQEGYEHNTENTSLEETAGDYWTATRHAASRHYQWDDYREARRLVIKHRLATVLDVGCGPAHKLMKLVAPHARVLGVDQPTIVDLARQIYPQGHFTGIDLESAYKSDEERFDLVLSAGVIEHLLDPDICMEYICSSCHADTLVLISTVDRDAMHGLGNLDTAKRARAHVREWNQAEFAQYIESHGFEILRQELVPPFRVGMSKRMLRYRWFYFRRRIPFRNLQRIMCRLRR